VDFRFDTTGQAFDQALLMLARKAEINVACDAYPRPELFGPAGARPVLAAATLGEALDQLTTYYGYVYWKLGDFYLFRSRNWADEQRVAVPDRVLQSLTAGVAWPDSLSSGELLALAALTDEQLLTLHLTGRANGGATVAAEAFDLNEVHLARSGLVMFSQLTPSQRSLARTRGIPLRLLPAGPRALFAAAAYDRNITLDPADEGSGFRIIPPPSRQAGAAGPSSNVLQFIFDFGEPGIRRSDLSLWLPAPPRAAP